MAAHHPSAFSLTDSPTASSAAGNENAQVAVVPLHQYGRSDSGALVRRGSAASVVISVPDVMIQDNGSMMTSLSGAQSSGSTPPTPTRQVRDCYRPVIGSRSKSPRLRVQDGPNAAAQTMLARAELRNVPVRQATREGLWDGRDLNAVLAGNQDTPVLDGRGGVAPHPIPVFPLHLRGEATRSEGVDGSSWDRDEYAKAFAAFKKGGRRCCAVAEIVIVARSLQKL